MERTDMIQDLRRNLFFQAPGEEWREEVEESQRNTGIRKDKRW
jgi:hypothetical protein